MHSLVLLIIDFFFMFTSVEPHLFVPFGPAYGDREFPPGFDIVNTVQLSMNRSLLLLQDFNYKELFAYIEYARLFKIKCKIH